MSVFRLSQTDGEVDAMHELAYRSQTQNLANLCGQHGFGRFPVKCSRARKPTKANESRSAESTSATELKRR